jgi:predicted nucleotidyltransferase
MKNMNNIGDIKRTITEEKEDLRKKFQVKEIGIFGSYVRGEQKKKSDIDILVEFEEPTNLSLLDFIRLENYLSTILGVKVDLVRNTRLNQESEKMFLKK